MNPNAYFTPMNLGKVEGDVERILPLLSEAASLWGIGMDWRINILRGEEVPEAGEGFDGGCRVDAVYLRMDLFLTDSLDEESEAYVARVVSHEVGHAALAPLERIVDHILELVAAKYGEEVAAQWGQLYSDTTETTLQRITRGQARYRKWVKGMGDQDTGEQ